jgi:hypothetical protein
LFEHVTFAVDPVEHDPTVLNRIFHLHNLKGAEPPYLLALFLAGASGLLPFA